MVADVPGHGEKLIVVERTDAQRSAIRIQRVSDHRPSRRLVLLDQFHHLSGLSVPPDFPLREHEIAVDDDLVDPARGFDQLNVGVAVRFLDLGRQTGGPRFVTSDAAVFDGDLHSPSVA